MNDVFKDEDPCFVKFVINSHLDLEKYRKEFYRRSRVRVRNFINYEAADALYHHLDREAPWRTFGAANKEILEIAQSGEKNGFAAVYDAIRLFAEDVNEGTDPGRHASGTVLASCDAFFASEQFSAWIRKIVGLEVKRVATQAIRLRAGHFVTFHSATLSEDQTGMRRVEFALNLTPEWRPEHGGLTEFRLGAGDVIEAYMPVFNALDIQFFPQGWWISTVTPTAPDPVYAVRGRLYLE